MVSAVGIVGYKNSGKTTLSRALASELLGRGYQVAVLKHTVHSVSSPGKDTTILGKVVHQVGIVSPCESALFWDRPLSVEEMMARLEVDLVLVEGFKTEETYPKVACLRGRADDADLFDGLVLCAVGPSREVVAPDGEVPFFDRDDVGPVADLVAARAFKLPALDCGACGHPRCAGLAREIVAGVRTSADCAVLALRGYGE